MYRRDIETPFGSLVLSAENGAVTRVAWGVSGRHDDTPVLRQAECELRQYATGSRRAFDVPLRLNVSEFQRQVCAKMQAIPFGETRTYGDLAMALDAMPQAVGQACGANPVPILIPCHRVMGAGGRLVGFSGGSGVETKVALLRHENAGGFLL